MPLKNRVSSSYQKEKNQDFLQLNVYNDQDTTQSYLTYKEPWTWNTLLREKEINWKWHQDEPDIGTIHKDF